MKSTNWHSRYLNGVNTYLSVVFLCLQFQLYVEQRYLWTPIALGLHLKPSIAERLLERNTSNQQRILQQHITRRWDDVFSHITTNRESYNSNTSHADEMMSLVTPHDDIFTLIWQISHTDETNITCRWDNVFKHHTDWTKRLTCHWAYSLSETQLHSTVFIINQKQLSADLYCKHLSLGNFWFLQQHDQIIYVVFHAVKQETKTRTQLKQAAQTAKQHHQFIRLQHIFMQLFKLCVMSECNICPHHLS